VCVFHCHSVTTERCCALLSVAHTTWQVALLGVCYCLTAMFTQQTSCLRKNVAWTHSTDFSTRRLSARIFPCPLGLSIDLLKFKAWCQRCVSKTHSNTIPLVNAQLECNNCTLFRLLESNHRQAVYQTYKRKLFPFVFKWCTHPDNANFDVKKTCSCYLQLLHYSCATTDYILLLSVFIPLTSVYSRATLLQNPTAILTVAWGGAVRWGSLENFQLNHFCSNSVSLRCIHPLTEKIPKEFSLGWSASGTWSWQICQPNSDRCQNKSVCPTFHPLSEPSWLVRETFTFTFVKIHVVNTQVAHREQVRGPIIHVIRHNGSGVVVTEYKNQGLML
jgi:hypothetical protein